MELVRNEETLMLGKKRKNGFRLSSKNLFLTYPRCPMQKEEALIRLQKRLPDLQYAMIAKELHIDGYPHLHCLLTNKKKVNITNPDLLDLDVFHGNYQSARCTDDVRDYILKSDPTPLEWGTYLSNNHSAVQKRAIENKTIIDTPLTELVENGTISMFQYNLIRNAKEQYLMDKKELPDIMESRQCFWIYGDPGIGKTYYVREKFPGCFVKPQNKWWDGYQGQDVVILDDFDCTVIGHNLKIWSDKYSFNAEIKGSTIKPVYTKLFVTSNYLPEQLWKDDLVLAKAVERRFRFCTIKNRQLVDWRSEDLIIL